MKTHDNDDFKKQAGCNEVDRYNDNDDKYDDDVEDHNNYCD